jgi:acetyl-CoA acyltransferase 1
MFSLPPGLLCRAPLTSPQILKATLNKTKIDPSKVEDVTIGNVLPELGGAKAGRMALIHSGFPYTTAFNTVNRQCSSGLQAITNVAQQIQTGMINIGIGGGVESMTRNYGSRAIPVDLSPELKTSPNQDALDCIMVCPPLVRHKSLRLT